MAKGSRGITPDDPDEQTGIKARASGTSVSASNRGEAAGKMQIRSASHVR